MFFFRTVVLQFKKLFTTVRFKNHAEVMAKKIKQRKIWTGWIKLLGIIPIINWLPFLIVGLVVKNKKWILFSILYVSPLVLLIVSILIGGDIESELNDLLFLSLWLSWLIALIHAIYMSNEYPSLLRKKWETKQNEFDWLTFKKRDKAINVLSREHQRIINKMLNELREINRKYNKVNSLYQVNFMDIVIMLEDFIDQTIELIKKEEHLDKITKKISVSKIELKIKELSSKIGNTEIREFKEEYKITLNNYKKRKNVCIGFVDQKVQIDLKLNNYIMRCKEIKRDFMNLNFSTAGEKEINILIRTEEITKDVNSQINILSDTLKELNINLN